MIYDVLKDKHAPITKQIHAPTMQAILNTASFLISKSGSWRANDTQLFRGLNYRGQSNTFEVNGKGKGGGSGRIYLRAFIYLPRIDTPGNFCGNGGSTLQANARQDHLHRSLQQEGRTSASVPS